MLKATMLPHRVLSALCVLVLFSTDSLACNSIVLKDDLCGGGAVVSATSFSEVYGFFSGLIAVPKGGKLPILQITADKESSFGSKLEFLYATTCLGHDANKLFANSGVLPIKPGQVQPPTGYYICNQGMNDQGLCVSFQAQRPIPTGPDSDVPEYDPASPKKKAFNYFDSAAVLLARFKSVAEVKEALTNEYQAVASPATNLYGTGQWVGVYDATGAAVVVQWKNKQLEVVDNPLGVLANNNVDEINHQPIQAPDFLQEQYQTYYNFLKSVNGTQTRPFTTDSSGFINGPWHYTDATGKSSWSEADVPNWTARAIGAGNLNSLPGGFQGDARFVRMAMLKSAALLSCFPPNATMNPTSPANPPADYPKNWQSLQTVAKIIESVTLPRGMTDAGLMGTQTREPTYRMDQTFWYTLRDHDNKIFYYRAPNSFEYRMVDLQKVDWKKILDSGKTRFLPLRPPKNAGFNDFTARVSTV